MCSLTLIPNTDSYGVMVLAVLALGSFNIARHIHIRWFPNKLSYMASNALVKTIIVFLGVLVIPASCLISLQFPDELYSITLGFYFAVITIMIEIKFIRHINRKKLRQQEADAYQPIKEISYRQVTRTMSLSSAQRIHEKGLSYIRKDYLQFADKPDMINYHWSSSIIAAITEEILFRGYLMIMASWINSPLLKAFVILLIVFAFAFSHVSQSWFEFVSKLPLSLLTTLIVLLTGSVLGAIITHVIFNGYAYYVLKKSGRSKAHQRLLSR